MEDRVNDVQNAKLDLKPNTHRRHDATRLRCWQICSWLIETVAIANSAHRRRSNRRCALSSNGKSSRRSCPRCQNFVLGLEDLSSACPRTFYFGLVKMRVMLELVVLTYNYQFHYVLKLLNVVTRTIIWLTMMMTNDNKDETLIYWTVCVVNIIILKVIFGLGKLASASWFWPRPQEFVLI